VLIKQTFYCLAVLAITSANGCADQSVPVSCIKGNFVHEKLVKKNEAAIEFSFSKSCFRGRLNDGEQLLITAYTKDLIDPNSFEDLYIKNSMSESDRLALKAYERIDLTLSYVSVPGFIARMKEDFLKNSGHVDKNENYWVLKKNKYVPFNRIYFPIGDAGVYIGCINTCELNAVYHQNIHYAISFSANRFDDWREFNDIAVDFIRKTSNK